jgi:hypothetical protein
MPVWPASLIKWVTLFATQPLISSKLANARLMISMRYIRVVLLQRRACCRHR